MEYLLFSFSNIGRRFSIKVDFTVFFALIFDHEHFLSSRVQGLGSALFSNKGRRFAIRTDFTVLFGLDLVFVLT